ncbi:MAG TPA: glycosyltransferase [Pyrinomonadaceae bacterium]|nr:glycosyltransferase [Pyrinomonadaceae bacterium]
MKNIMIAGASQGFGHVKAAVNLSHALRKADRSNNLRVIDVFDYFPTVLRLVAKNGWSYTSTHFHKGYSRLYKRSITCSKSLLFGEIIRKYGVNPIIAELRSNPPDVFIATHAMALPLGEALKKEFGCKFFSVATDFILHSGHVTEGVDLIFTPAKYERALNGRQLQSFRRRIVTTGIPIDSLFARSKNQNNLLKEYGFITERKTVLVSFGGDGINAIRNVNLLIELERSGLPLQFLVLTGKNKKFHAIMENLFSGNKAVKIISFQDSVSDLYTAADFFVGKAGGLSISEAVAKNLPMFFVDRLPGQEEFNVKVISELNLGTYTPSYEILEKKIRLLLKNDFRDGIGDFDTIARPNSSETIAGLVLAY